MPGDMRMQRARRGQADEVATGHFAKIDMAPFCQLVAAGGNQHQAVAAEGNPLDRIRQGMLGRQSEVGSALDTMAWAMSALSRSSTSIERCG